MWREVSKRLSYFLGCVCVCVCVRGVHMTIDDSAAVCGYRDWE